MTEYNIISWISGKTLFITGGTGFLGKVLVEKVLRECKDVQKIYLLFRARDKFELFDRFVQYKQNQVFGRINPNDMQKLHPIHGDLGQIRMGLSENDQNRLISEVDIIVHSGASVKFNENLHDAVMLNIRGTREVANLARKMSQLKAFVHVSTAFSNCHISNIKEKIYDADLDPDRVIDICERGVYHQIAKLIENLYPNMYIFSKKLSEQVIAQYADELPIAIVRPSIITPSEKDPYPGWMDSRNGPMGLIMGAASGLIRSVYGFKWAIADLIPVDKVANGIIAVAVEVGINEMKSCPVYNMISSNEAPITWHHFLEIEKEITTKNPYPMMVWYPGGGIHENIISYYFSFILFQLLPSLIADCVLLILRKRPWLLRLQIKAYKNLNLLSYFLSQTWTWKTANCTALHHKLNLREKSIFNFQMSNMDYVKYFENWHTGSKKFYLKVEEQASKKTMMKMRIFFCLEIILKCLCYLFVGYVFVKIFGQHNLMQLPKLETCGECSSVYTSLKGGYMRK